MRESALLVVVLLGLAGGARADEDGRRVDPYAGWGPKLDAVLAQVPSSPGDAGRLLAVIDAAQRDPDPVGAFVRGLAGLEGDLRVTGPAMKLLLLQLGLQNEQLAADRAAAGLPPGPPAPPIAAQLARSLTGITKVGPSIVIDRAGGPLDLPLPGGGGRFARLGERIAFSAQRGPGGEPVIGPAPVFEVEDGEERLKTYRDHGWIAGLEVVNADGKVSRAIRSLGLRERRGRRVVELAVDAYGNRELFVRTPIDAGVIDRSRGPIPRGPALSTLDKVTGLLSSRPTTSTPSGGAGIVGLLGRAFSGSKPAPPGPEPKPKPSPPGPEPTPAPPGPPDERRAEIVPDDQLPPLVARDGPDERDAVAVGGDEAADPVDLPEGSDDPRGAFLDPDAPDERDAVAVEDDAPPTADGAGEDASTADRAGEDTPTADRAGEDAPTADGAGEDAPTADRAGEDAPTADRAGEDAPTSDRAGEGAAAGPGPRGAPRDDAPDAGASPAPGAQPARAPASPASGRRSATSAPAPAASSAPDPLASILQPLAQGLSALAGGGAKRGGAAKGPSAPSPSAGPATADDPALAATRAAVRALLRRALAQPRARRVDVLLDGLDPLVASRPRPHEPLIRRAIARAVLDRRFR